MLAERKHLFREVDWLLTPLNELETTACGDICASDRTIFEVKNHPD